MSKAESKNLHEFDYDMSWVEDSACLGICEGGEEDLFFPKLFEKKVERIEREAIALSFCAVCPVVNDCLRFAIIVNDVMLPADRSDMTTNSLGIWGGMRPKERKEWAKKWHIK